MSKKTVHFNSHVVVHEYYLVIPCLQEYLYWWDQGKKEFLMISYQKTHGTLVGFDLEKALQISQQEDELLDEILKKEENKNLQMLILNGKI